jgi:hypothetical protein
MLAKYLHYFVLKSDSSIIHAIGRVAVCSYVAVACYRCAYGTVKIVCNELVFPANAAYDGLLDREQELTANRAYSCERQCLLSLWQPQIQQLEVNLQKCVLLYLNIYRALIIVGGALPNFGKGVQFPILAKPNSVQTHSNTHMSRSPLLMLI